MFAGTLVDSFTHASCHADLFSGDCHLLSPFLWVQHTFNVYGEHLRSPRSICAPHQAVRTLFGYLLGGRATTATPPPSAFLSLALTHTAPATRCILFAQATSPYRLRTRNYTHAPFLHCLHTPAHFRAPACAAYPAPQHPTHAPLRTASPASGTSLYMPRVSFFYTCVAGSYITATHSARRQFASGIRRWDIQHYLNSRLPPLYRTHTWDVSPGRPTCLPGALCTPPRHYCYLLLPRS